MPDSQGDTSVGGGSGGGGSLGTPSTDSKETPTSGDQDENMVVSGGGVARESEDETSSS